MSVQPGATIRKDPSAQLLYEFDWTDWLGAASIATSTFTITGPDSALTKDNPTIVSGSKKTSVRVLGGTAGKTYKLNCNIVTNETPTQTDDRSVNIAVREQ